VVGRNPWALAGRRLRRNRAGACRFLRWLGRGWRRRIQLDRLSRAPLAQRFAGARDAWVVRRQPRGAREQDLRASQVVGAQRLDRGGV